MVIFVCFAKGNISIYIFFLTVYCFRFLKKKEKKKNSCESVRSFIFRGTRECDIININHNTFFPFVTSVIPILFKFLFVPLSFLLLCLAALNKNKTKQNTFGDG